ncbi:PTS system ascorbate-specific IIA component [Spinactinospora alkalitolerans]|uniref:Ascorbate-specific PTS system EIIA component n=1 Tax=Spinactinospora alkalitolerans TaxID=687207 RepID=A0A852TVU4_9ACTN|nr:PTS sugar transporter subunit IIA [Spinactinospora alkalitolerans]NYE46194.1 PTS system ascorbate-specific IIA component [Spinactinospora alkalitolerans]
MEEPALSRLLPVEAVVTGIEAEDWRAAIRAAGELLVAAGATTGAYTEQMQRAVEEYGPYIVIAPGLALAHSRPSGAVLRDGLSWAGLASPVKFGHPRNDPVRLVIGLAALDHDGHSAALARLAGMLGDPDRREALLDADGPARVHAVIADYEKGPR